MDFLMENRDVGPIEHAKMYTRKLDLLGARESKKKLDNMHI